MNLNWCLAIATRDRVEALCACVESALAQSCPPAEVVIVDASRDWETSRDRVLSLLSRHSPQTRLWYGHSPRAQQTVQRNLAIDHSTADVLFMVDDDTLLRRDAAERVLQAYESNPAASAIGIGAMQDWGGRDCTDDSAPMLQRHQTLGRRIAWEVVGRWFFAKSLRRPLGPVKMAGEGVTTVRGIEGFQLTVRRDVAVGCRFDENLVSGHFEDFDASYRFMARGPTFLLNRPLIYHAVAPRPEEERRRGTLARFGWVMNIAYLNRKYFGGGAYVRLFCWTHWLRCLPIDVFTAVTRRDASRLRGLWHALAGLLELTGCRQSDIGRVVASRTETLKSGLALATTRPTGFPVKSLPTPRIAA